MRGTISSAGFASGDRFVVGRWLDSPVGPTADVMWATPSGRRILLAPDLATADFVSSVYGFEETRIVEFTCDASPAHLDLDAGPVALHLTAGRAWRIGVRRPAWFTQWIERPVASAVMGVRTYGVSPTGVEEWYQADAWRWITAGTATVNGIDLGALGQIRPACGFGFSEPPERPSIVEVRPLLRAPEGTIRVPPRGTTTP